MDLNEAVRTLRAKTGDSQQAFATRLGISIRAIVNYEKDRKPSPRTLAAMAHLADKYEDYNLASQFWVALPPELRTMPVIIFESWMDKEDIQVIKEMLPIPRHKILERPGAWIALTDPRPTLGRCVSDLDSLTSGNDPGVSGQAAETIRKTVDRLRKLYGYYGQRVPVIPGKVMFGRKVQTGKKPKDDEKKRPR